MTNFLITVPIHLSRLEDKGDALFENVILNYCIPAYTFMDLDSILMSPLNELFV